MPAKTNSREADELLHQDIQQRFSLAAQSLAHEHDIVASRIHRAEETLVRGVERSNELSAAVDTATQNVADAQRDLDHRRSTILGDYFAGAQKERLAQAQTQLDSAESMQKEHQQTWKEDQPRIEERLRQEQSRFDSIIESREKLQALHRDYLKRRDEFAQEAIQDRGRGAEANRIPEFQSAGGELSKQRFGFANEQRQAYSQELQRGNDFAQAFAQEREPLNKAYSERLASIDNDKNLNTRDRLDQQLEAKQSWHQDRASLAQSLAEKHGAGNKIDFANRIQQREQNDAQRVGNARDNIDNRFSEGATPNQIRDDAGFERGQREVMAQRDLQENPSLTEAYKHEGVYSVPMQSPDMNMAPSWAGGNNQSAVSSRQVEYQNSAQRVSDAYVDDTAQRGNERQAQAEQQQNEPGEGHQVGQERSDQAATVAMQEPEANQQQEQPQAIQKQEAEAQYQPAESAPQQEHGLAHEREYA